MLTYSTSYVKREYNPTELYGNVIFGHENNYLQWLNSSTRQIRAPSFFGGVRAQCCSQESCMPSGTIVFVIESEFEFSESIYNVDGY